MIREPFGTLADGTTVHRWEWERAGTRVRVLTYGGIVQSLEVPDREGQLADIVLGLGTLAEYERHNAPYFGAIVGRYANRIAGGHFTLDGHGHTLARNHEGNSLHGGARGFDKRVWAAAEVPYGVTLRRTSPHGEEGFPGTVDVRVTYTLTESGALRIDYRATTDAPTVLSLTNHSYFNLAGAGTNSLRGHTLSLHADQLVPTAADGIPTGGPVPVDGSHLDLRTPREVATGHDHCFVLANGPTTTPRDAAELRHAPSGRILTVATTEPGLQLFTADGLNTLPHGPSAGVALETQHFPDSPNHPHFPTTTLRPGEHYTSTTVCTPSTST